MSESSGVIMWPNQMGVILDAILVNYGGYLSGPLKWVRFVCNMGESSGVFEWPTKMILFAILVDQVG